VPRASRGVWWEAGARPLSSVRLCDLCVSVFVFVFVLAIALLPASVSAQGRVAGLVKDAAGQPIKGATITAQSPDFAPTTVTSDAKGRYAFLGLRGGAWTFTVSAPGFREARRQARTRTVGVNAPVDFELDAVMDVAPPGPLASLDTRALQQQLAAAAALEDAGKLDEAIAAYRGVLTRLPALKTVHLQLGLLYERKGDKASAVTEYEAAIKADPANAKARAALDRLASR
jgi:tetratricopeptide (TPR) repeat protein